MLVWRCHQLLSGFLAKGHLPRVSRRSLMIRGITSARRPSDEGAVRPVIASNRVPFLRMRSVGSHRTSGWEKGGIKERADNMTFSSCLIGLGTSSHCHISEQRLQNNKCIIIVDIIVLLIPWHYRLLRAH